MCCFSPVSTPLSWIGRLLGAGRVRVSNTSIFARLEDGGTQVLAYAMTMSARSEVAMILPVPTPPGADEDALSFIDLHDDPHLFSELAMLFEWQATAAVKSARTVMRSQARTLKVHEVGSFVASFVPSRADFGRLEARFRLPDAVWDAVPDARDFGFAVFQLEAGAHTIHPMAFRFRTRDPKRLFFPTLHVHDGRVHARARFDHALYYQHPALAEPRRSDVLPDFLGGAQVGFGTARSDYHGVVVRAQPILRRTLRGRLPNRDTYVEV